MKLEYEGAFRTDLVTKAAQLCSSEASQGRIRLSRASIEEGFLAVRSVRRTPLERGPLKEMGLVAYQFRSD